ncbi:hypothetical protein VB773_19760 [Haloarculaceae archaeon H-GB2-1]|nr:hypothetical protein [Haloarculaceae archaeon H-GB1-1]MEA5409591.1 hypothetical protein [Haloarculaceae archaeon H-GB2-1]
MAKPDGNPDNTDDTAAEYKEETTSSEEANEDSVADAQQQKPPGERSQTDNSEPPRHQQQGKAINQDEIRQKWRPFRRQDKDTQGKRGNSKNTKACHAPGWTVLHASNPAVAAGGGEQ